MKGNEHREKSMLQGKPKGSATVEAALILPLLIIAMVSVLSVVRITGTYERMQHALNQVAAELSQYSYLYAVSGLKEHHDAWDGEIEKAQEEFIEQQNRITDFYRIIQGQTEDNTSEGKTEGNALKELLSMMENIRETQKAWEALSPVVDKIVGDPVGEFRLIGLAFSDTLMSQGKTAIMTVMTKSLIKGYLSKELSVSVNELDKKLRLENGVEGLDLSSSTFFDDRETIDLIMEYTIKPVPNFLILPEIRLRNRASVLAWTWGADSTAGWKNDETDLEDSIWNIDQNKDTTGQHLGRGNTIDKRFAEELAGPLGEYAEVTPYHFKTIDVIEYARKQKNGTLYTIFSLNPFLPTYHKKSAVVGVMKKNIKSLSAFESYQVKDFTIDLSVLSGQYNRVVYVVVPENRDLPEAFMEAFEECRQYAGKYGIEMKKVQRYGEYGDEPDENEQQAENTVE